MIEIVTYRSAWRQEFLAVGGGLRAMLGARALRIDHMGSTSVPGLAAKDVIDVQLTVGDFDAEVGRVLEERGYRRLHQLTDHIPPGAHWGASDWQKWVFIEPPGMRRLNLHVRQEGRANQRYALLFRDYLRTHSSVAEAYAQVKRALATMHPEDKDAYYEVKDPVCDIIMEGAEAWAAGAGWQPGPSDA